MPEPTDGRVVLVTGASRGIGAAVARRFAAAGDRVVCHHRGSPELAEQVRDSLDGEGHLVAGADLGDPDAIAALVEQVAAAYGRIDVLVNNAGMLVEHHIEDTTYDEWQRAWQRVLAVNLVGPANLAWCAVRHMPRGGRIVNVSSRGAFRGEPRQPAYGASKAGLNSLSQSLARALGPRGIAVSAVAPGFTDTDMAAAALSGEERERREAESPLGRIATPDEVAAACFYLASAEAELASGTVLDVNGASYLR